jgi:hypothetical protein
MYETPRDHPCISQEELEYIGNPWEIYSDKVTIGNPWEINTER